MKTPLALRSLNVRLATAYMAHAVNNYMNCKPGNSFTRFGTALKCACKDEFSNDSWYTMWCSIGDFYNEMDFGEMSDEEIIEQYNGALRVGFTYRKQIEASAVQSAVKAWSDRKWKRYVQKSSSRHKWTGRAALIAALTCVGVPTPPSA